MLFHFIFGCVSELQNKDFAPTLEVLSQADEWLINEGESIYLDLLVWDDQITEGGVMVSWSSDRDGLLAEQFQQRWYIDPWSSRFLETTTRSSSQQTLAFTQKRLRSL